ncbi:MAG TPA: hypothetical protein GXX46_01510 [Peptococcaceae bacterium]|nr:hypothetical protein [Peptococcaceae bacterium]
MYMLKICRCCDAILGELDREAFGATDMDLSLEIVGNVAYALCPQCMQELDINSRAYLH